MLFAQYVEDAEIIYNDKGSKGFNFIMMARAQAPQQHRGGGIIKVNLATVKNSAPKSLCSPASQFRNLWPVSSTPKTLSTIVWRKLIPHTNPPSPRTMLEAEARLAEAQLTVLQLRQNMIYQQFTNGLCAGGDIDDQQTRGERKIRQFEILGNGK